MVIENYYITTNIGINYHNLLPLYKQVRAQAYTVENVKSAFAKPGQSLFYPT